VGSGKLRHESLLIQVSTVYFGFEHCREGYIRTSSEIFVLDSRTLTNKFVHLTNNAIQKHSEKYGKFEDGNQMSFRAFDVGWSSLIYMSLELYAVEAKSGYFSRVFWPEDPRSGTLFHELGKGEIKSARPAALLWNFRLWLRHR
jgi:hypothetical protein